MSIIAQVEGSGTLTEIVVIVPVNIPVPSNVKAVTNAVGLVEPFGLQGVQDEGSHGHVRLVREPRQLFV